MKKETDVGWDPSNKVEKITPIKSIKELKSVQEITKMTPVKGIEEVISMKEIKSIKEIKERIAREFIRKHGLKNLIAGGSGSFMEGENGPRSFGDTKLESMEDNPRAEDTDDNTDIIEQELETLEKNILKDEAICDDMSKELDEMKSKLSAFEKVKENHCSLKETEITAYEGLKDKVSDAKDYGFDGFGDVTWEVMRDNDIEDETIEEIESVVAKEVLSKTGLKSVQEVKSLHPVKTIQEVKNLYALTEKQVEQLKDEMAARQWGV